MTPARDVTECVLRYRECARHTWNTYFRDLPDGWHEFMDVDTELFNALVMVQVFDGCYPTAESPRPRVRPRFGTADEFEVLWARSRDGTSWNWKPVTLPRGNHDLEYVSFFDWDRDGYRDFELVRARVHSSPAKKLVGGEMLIPALRVDFHAPLLVSSEGR